MMTELYFLGELLMLTNSETLPTATRAIVSLNQNAPGRETNLSHPLSCLLSHQSHPASLKLLIEAEGEQLLLALEKNE